MPLDEFIIREVIDELAKISLPKTADLDVELFPTVADWGNWKRKVHKILEDAYPPVDPFSAMNLP